MGAAKRPGLAQVSLAVARDYGRFKAEQARWIKGRLALLPAHWRKRAAREYARLSAASEFAGNSWLRETAEAARARLSVASSDDEIRVEAERAALDGIELVARSNATTLTEARRILEDHCRAWGIEPAGQGGDPAMARMLCARWWLRRLRASVARNCEALAIGAQMVCRGVWPYASQDGVERRRAQRRRNALAISRAVLRDEVSGDERPLAEVVAGSVANPVNRRNELMTRIRGCEEWATARSWGAEFWTLTTPSRFHAQRMAGGISEANPIFDGSTPAAAQAYLCAVWARARAAWKRRGLRVFGMRVAEPHHDATPHWHVLVFGARRDVRFARRLLAVYARRDSAGEPGAKLHRFRAEAIDAARGDAAGYVAKYVAKNIDGFGVGLDEETGRKAGAMVRRCDTWAAAWRIRQFQFFGTPAVGVWRELRKQEGTVAVAEIERARQAADAGDFCAYVEAVGGCCIERTALRVWAVRGVPAVTEYGDEGAAPVVAVAAVGGRLLIERGRFSIRWGGLCLSRTRVNNCTPSAGAGCQSLIDVLEAGAKSGGARFAQSTFFE